MGFHWKQHWVHWWFIQKHWAQWRNSIQYSIEFKNVSFSNMELSDETPFHSTLSSLLYHSITLNSVISFIIALSSLMFHSVTLSYKSWDFIQYNIEFNIVSFNNIERSDDGIAFHTALSLLLFHSKHWIQLADSI